MSKKPTKSIIASFGALSSALSEEPVKPPEESSAAARAPSRVGAGIIGATQRSLSEIREERDRLQALVAQGGVLEIEPNLIDPSPFPDRLPGDEDAEFEALKKAILAEGQKVPIQLRANPAASGRYQVVYGHRRWRAAKGLGIKVKAILTELTDDELVIAQGIENAVRQDLTWVERSLFAWRMDKVGIKPRDIKAALAIDDAELARLRAVPKALPVDVIEAIGRAPKAGRPRWSALARAVSVDPQALDRVRKTLSADKVSTSDERFRRALAAAVRMEIAKSDEMDLRAEEGAVIGRAIFKQGEVRLKIDKAEATAFAEFFRDELPALLERFSAVKSGDGER